MNDLTRTCAVLAGIWLGGLPLASWALHRALREESAGRRAAYILWWPLS